MNAALRCLALMLAAAVDAPAQTDEADFEAKLQASAQSFSDRIESTTRELVDARQRIGAAKSDLARDLREAQSRVLNLKAEAELLAERQAELAAREARSASEVDLLRQNLHHIERSVAATLSAMRADRRPGEGEAERQSIDLLLEALATQDRASPREAVRDALGLLEARLIQAVGGYRSPGSALAAGNNRLNEGDYLVFGPAAYFKSADDTLAGVTARRGESDFAVVHPAPSWSAESASALVAGERAELPLDPTGGKALRLEQERRGVWNHVRKGGMVGYTILGLGLFALATALFKLWDLRHMKIDAPERVARALQHLANNEPSRFESSLGSFKRATRELMQVGLRDLGKPKLVIEERLYANILVQRLRSEKLLPMLRVIATAAPLLGLLGTVVGMVKTFTLITVFGTGNAEKLSSGISGALVTTELGLVVAIPTLVAYGFLSQRSHRCVSLLEQYSVEFMAASEESKTSGQARS